MIPSLVTAPASEPLTAAEARTQCKLDDSNGEPSPAAPTAALASPAAPGNVDNGAHRYLTTFVTADGETEAGDATAAVTVADKTVNGQVSLTNIATGGALVTSRKVYRTVAAGSVYKLLTTIANNTATTYTDNIADSALGADAPSTNTTLNPELLTLISAVRERGEMATGRQFIRATWEIWLDRLPCSGWIDIPRPPLVSISSFKYYDTSGVLQTWDAANYVVSAPSGPRAARGRVVLADGINWPTLQYRPDAVRIQFLAGYGTTGASVPAILRQAMLLDLATLYTYRTNMVSGPVSALPLSATSAAIYRGFRVYPQQRAA